MYDSVQSLMLVYMSWWNQISSAAGEFEPNLFSPDHGLAPWAVAADLHQWSLAIQVTASAKRGGTSTSCRSLRRTSTRSILTSNTRVSTKWRSFARRRKSQWEAVAVQSPSPHFTRHSFPVSVNYSRILSTSDESLIKLPSGSSVSWHVKHPAL